MSFTEGSVIIEADVSEPGRTVVHTASTRQGEIARAVTGQPIDSPLPQTLIESLYALCPQAHLAAFNCALAAAQGKPLPEYNRKVTYEIISEHMRFLAFDAQNSVGLTPDPEVKRLGVLRALMTAELAKAEPDFDKLDAAIEPLIAHFVTGCEPARFTALQSLPDFEAWMMRSASAASRLFAELWENVPCRKHTQIAMLDPKADLEIVEHWFEGNVSMNCPLINGTAHQTSAESRCAEHPLLAEISEQYSCGVRAQFASRLIDLFNYWSGRTKAEGTVRAASPSPGIGIALVQCARGTLVTRIAVEDGILANVQSFAPTEWNFAHGSCAESVISAIPFEDEAQFRKDCAWVVAAIDPCVPYTLKIQTAPES